jgi:ketosteroid isomerase-like protein
MESGGHGGDTWAAMPDANAQVFLQALELWNEGEDLAGWAEFYDPDVVVTAPEGWPEGAETIGLDAWREQAERLRSTWKEARTEVDEIRSVGEDRVLVRIRYVTKGERTEVPFDTAMVVVVHLKEGKITRADYFWDLDRALEAAGLTE